MDHKVVVFREPNEQKLGLLRYAGVKVPAEVVFFFPNVPRLTQVTSHGMGETIHLYMLDGQLRLSNKPIRLRPERLVTTIHPTEHILETSIDYPVITNFEFLEPYL